MKLTHAQLRAIHDDGYVKVENVIPRIMVDAALRAINANIGRGMPPDQMARFGARSFCPELQSAPALIGLFNDTPLRSLLSSALGCDLAPVTSCQIALRFPVLVDPPPAPGAHLDGIATPDNGGTPGELWSFTSLVGVFLSDTPSSDMGNFTAWPGSHERYAVHFREHGTEKLANGAPAIALGPPRPVLAHAGDAAICHYQLGHGITANTSPYIRYAVFFRILHPNHGAEKWDVLTDIWRHWPGVTSAV